MAGPSRSSSNNQWRGGAKVVFKPELGHRVDEAGGHVQPEASLADAVVVGEGGSCENLHPVPALTLASCPALKE